QADLRADVEVAQAVAVVVQVGRYQAGSIGKVVIRDRNSQLPAVEKAVADAGAGLVPEEDLLVRVARLAQHRVPLVVIDAKIPTALGQGVTAQQGEQACLAGGSG